MDVKQRIILGAIGGITPYLVTLLSIDFGSAFTSYQIFDWIGLVVRSFILIFLGSFVAYLHRTETEPFKVFQLGLAAPALLATFINGGVGNNEVTPTPMQTSQYSISLFSEAIAADEKYINQDMLKKSKISNTSRFFRGLLGTKLNKSTIKSYSVIVGSHQTYQQAKAQVKELLTKKYKAIIYKPYDVSKHYAVAIASNITEKEAISIKKKAIANGLPSDTYLWTY